MPGWFEQFQGDLARLWGQFSASQRWLVGGIAAALLLGLVAVSLAIYIAPGGEFLAGNLDNEEMAQISEYLDREGVKYEIRDDEIYVSGDRRRILGQYARTANEKKLGGWSILKEYNWSQTSAQFSETRLRALEEELEITIEKGWDSVSWARVQLTERREGLFESTTTKPTASVKIGASGGNLDPEQVKGVQWLVANSLPGLRPQDVVVTDQSLRPLAGYIEQTASELLTDEKRKAEELERQKRVKACAAILDPWVGPSNYTIAADVKVDYDRKAIKEKFVDGENAFVKTRRTEEVEEKTEKLEGVPGTPSNNPDDTIASGQGGGGGNETSMTQETKEEESEPRLVRETSTEVAPGDIEMQQISIVVNHALAEGEGEKSYQPRSAEDMKLLEQALMTAVAHVRDNTSYYFTLTQAPFDRSLAVEAESDAQWRSVRQNAESGAFVLAALLSLVVFFFILRRVFSMKPEYEETTFEHKVETSAGNAYGLSEFGLRQIGEDANLPPEEQKSKMIKDQVSAYAKGNSEGAATILKNWLAE